MPYKSRLMQAIRDEESKLFQQRAFLIAGPGSIVLIFTALAGWFAVNVIRAPELFGGGMFELIGYGVLGVVILLSLTKGYAFDKWVEAWLHLDIVHRAKVAKIEAVMAKLEKDELEKIAKAQSGAAPKKSEDSWQRAKSTATIATVASTETSS